MNIISVCVLCYVIIISLCVGEQRVFHILPRDLTPQHIGIIAIVVLFFKVFKVFSLMNKSWRIIEYVVVSFIFVPEERNWILERISKAFSPIVSYAPWNKSYNNIDDSYFSVSNYRKALFWITSVEIRSLAWIDTFANYIPHHHNPCLRGQIMDRRIEENLLKFKCIEYIVVGGGLGEGVYEAIRLTFIGILIVSSYRSFILKYGFHKCTRFDHNNPNIYQSHTECGRVFSKDDCAITSEVKDLI
jgi:hypothetical protein